MPRRTKNHGLRLAQVRAVIAGLTLSGSVSLELAATQLGTSPRTLQRRLCLRGIKFGKIVEETRLGIAGALLRETEMSIQEIANRIGYSTPGGFARAFGRWAGQSPRAYRSVSAQEAKDWRVMGRPIAGSKVASHLLKRTEET